MSVFDDFLRGVVDGATNLAQQDLKDFVTQTQDDTKAFLAQSEADLRTFTHQLATGELSKDEFADLVGGLKDLAVMQALTRAGIAATRIQRLRDQLINLVVDTAFKTFLV
jgi:hypothetical protein